MRWLERKGDQRDSSGELNLSMSVRVASLSTPSLLNTSRISLSQLDPF